MADVRFNTAEMLARIRQGAERGVVAATEDVRNEALRLILETPKSGRLYRRRGIVHQASAPGEPPASDTGALVSRTVTDYSLLDKLIGIVAARTKYAAYLEYGTARMEPRPFMRPALNNRREEIKKTISRAVSEAMR